MKTLLLNQSQIEHFDEFGFLPPVRILATDEAISLRAQVEDFEARHPELAGQLDFKANLILPAVDRWPCLALFARGLWQGWLTLWRRSHRK